MTVLLRQRSSCSEAWLCWNSDDSSIALTVFLPWKEGSQRGDCGSGSQEKDSEGKRNTGVWGLWLGARQVEGAGAEPQEVVTLFLSSEH